MVKGRVGRGGGRESGFVAAEELSSIYEIEVTGRRGKGEGRREEVLKNKMGKKETVLDRIG